MTHLVDSLLVVAAAALAAAALVVVADSLAAAAVWWTVGSRCAGSAQSALPGTQNPPRS